MFSGSGRFRFTQKKNCVVPEKIHTPPTEGFFGFGPPTPLEIPVLAGPYNEILAFKTSLPHRISNDPLWWGYGYFLEPHIVNKCSTNLKESIFSRKDQFIQSFTARFFHSFKHKLSNRKTGGYF